MYIENVFYYEPLQHKHEESKIREPRERFKQYYIDLHKRYNDKLDISTFVTGGQYKPQDLGYPIFDLCQKNCYLAKIDLMIMTYWAHEFDPDYASYGTHFAYRYQFNCQMFDILDQGSICTLTAFKFIMQYMLNSRSNMALCYSVDQNSIPREDVSSIVIPDKNISTGVVFKKESNSGIKILDIRIFTEQQICDMQMNIMNFVFLTLKELNIEMVDCSFYLKRNTNIYKSVQMYNQNFYTEHYKSFVHVNIYNGCTSICMILSQIIKEKKCLDKKYILIFDEDCESFCCGYLLLKLE